MARSESTIKVALSVKRVFQMWADISRFGDFLPHVTDVTPAGDGAFKLTLNANGHDEQTRIQMTATDESRLLIWRSSIGNGAKWNGEVRLRQIGEECEIRLIIDYVPTTMVTQPTIRSLYPQTWDVGGDLLAFRNFAEQVKQPKAGISAELPEVPLPSGCITPD